ncbi:hypothetical protein KM043_016413 [Ampulex compressa]|nr:hypothetical protein KM043_016413 [Ampulex compressa]
MILNKHACGHTTDIPTTHSGIRAFLLRANRASQWHALSYKGGRSAWTPVEKDESVRGGGKVLASPQCAPPSADTVLCHELSTLKSRGRGWTTKREHRRGVRMRGLLLEMMDVQPGQIDRRGMFRLFVPRVLIMEDHNLRVSLGLLVDSSSDAQVGERIHPDEPGKTSRRRRNDVWVSSVYGEGTFVIITVDRWSSGSTHSGSTGSGPVGSRASLPFSILERPIQV